ncbi:hypothetical protein, partial [Thioclava sp. F1Mire-8]|uniref:hypothetical protein n=1 Tax=Thioclava sp. F1Mire-8 TaxID=1973006 RepID=UPI00197DA10F
YAPVRIDHRPNRPHISSDIYQCQRARRQNQPASPQSLGALPANRISKISFAVSPLRAFPAPRCGVFRFGEAVFTDHTGESQVPFSKNFRFSPKNHSTH